MKQKELNKSFELTDEERKYLKKQFRHDMILDTIITCLCTIAAIIGLIIVMELIQA